MAFPSLEDACCRFDVLEKVVLEDNGVDSHMDEEKEAHAKILDLAQPYLPRYPPIEVLNVEV